MKMNVNFVCIFVYFCYPSENNNHLFFYSALDFVRCRLESRIEILVYTITQQHATGMYLKLVVFFDCVKLMFRYMNLKYALER